MTDENTSFILHLIADMVRRRIGKEQVLLQQPNSGFYLDNKKHI